METVAGPIYWENLEVTFAQCERQSGAASTNFDSNWPTVKLPGVARGLGDVVVTTR